MHGFLYYEKSNYQAQGLIAAAWRGHRASVALANHPYAVYDAE